MGNDHLQGEHQAQQAGHHETSHARITAAVRTIAGKMRTVPADDGGHGDEEHAAGWASRQVRHLLGLLDHQVGRIEVALPQVRDPELRAALDVVLEDAAARCGTLARDLDLARGAPLGEPDREWTAQVREGQGAAAPGPVVGHGM